MPGPADYDANEMMIKTSARGVAISQAERNELWTEKSAANIPGPGYYSEQKSTFGQANGGPTMGARIEEKISSNPGPGQYDQELIKNGASVRIGQAER